MRVLLRRTPLKVFMKMILPLIGLLIAAPLCAQPVDALKGLAAEETLNGEWRFKYIPSSDIGADQKFADPSFDVSSWPLTPVPSHWELHGYTEPQYAGKVVEGTGLYRRDFTVPKNWEGKRVFLRFEGVLYGLTAYVNGKSVGEWGSSYNPVTFDITDALAPVGKENSLAVQVTTRNKGWNFDNMDCWGLSGIYRDVLLFALPQIYLEDYTLTTTLNPDGGATVKVEVLAKGAQGIAGRLVSNGEVVSKFSIPISEKGSGSVSFQVENPNLWTAETPSLYTLELDVEVDGKATQQYVDRIGLRQVTIADGILKLNGTPVKLRGVNHHDIWPDGRVATEEKMRRDLQLIKEANINFIRTSHYPPHPRLIELCDEMGIYVEDEVPYTHGRHHLTDPDFQERLIARARATVMRDKNRASVLFWSLGNENPITELGNKTGEYVKKLDPTRPFTFPTMAPYFAEHWKEFPESMEIYAPHYPTIKRAVDYAASLTKPIVFTEYAHQRGLARAGTAVQDLWEVFYRSPRIAGGAIWVFQDQGILRETKDMKSVVDGDLMVWLDKNRYFDTRGFFGMDGLVYSDRTPQVDYWQVRKVYSPVQIRVPEITVEGGSQDVVIPIENRFDFRSLGGIKLKWEIKKNGSEIDRGELGLDAKAKQTQTVVLPISLPKELSNDVFSLVLKCEEDGQQIYERSLRLKTKKDAERWDALRAELSRGKPRLTMSDSKIEVSASAFKVEVDRATGVLSIVSDSGEILVSEMGPHMGRGPTMNDLAKRREREPEIWKWGLMRKPTNLQTNAHETAEGVEISINGDYQRPGKPNESVQGGYKLLVSGEGTIEVSYSYKPINVTGEVLEAGFGLGVPARQSEFRWIGQGPYAGYPGKDRLNEYGIHHLSRQDLYFPGNRRGVEFSLLTEPKGAGILLTDGSAGTIDVEDKGDFTIVSHLSLVPGEEGNSADQGENVDVSSRLKADSINEVGGQFTIVPLSSKWPQSLKTWFGEPGEAVEVKKPFLRSYDR